MMGQAQEAAEGEAECEGSEDDGEGIVAHVLLGLHQGVIGADGGGVVHVFGADCGGVADAFDLLGGVFGSLRGVVGEVFGGLG